MKQIPVADFADAVIKAHAAHVDYFIQCANKGSQLNEIKGRHEFISEYLEQKYPHLKIFQGFIAKADTSQIKDKKKGLKEFPSVKKVQAPDTKYKFGE